MNTPAYLVYENWTLSSNVRKHRMKHGFGFYNNLSDAFDSMWQSLSRYDNRSKDAEDWIKHAESGDETTLPWSASEHDFTVSIVAWEDVKPENFEPWFYDELLVAAYKQGYDLTYSQAKEVISLIR